MTRAFINGREVPETDFHDTLKRLAGKHPEQFAREEAEHNYLSAIQQTYSLKRLSDQVDARAALREAYLSDWSDFRTQGDPFLKARAA